jgi:hypothetical protein
VNAAPTVIVLVAVVGEHGIHAILYIYVSLELSSVPGHVQHSITEQLKFSNIFAISPISFILSSFFLTEK